MRPWMAGTISTALLLSHPWVSPARAEPPPPHQQSDEERAAARAAATEGVQLLEQGRYAEALDCLRRAEALVHAPTHLLYIARAQAKLGMLVEASETYVRIQHEALAPDAPRAFVDAQATAAQEGRDIDAHLPTLLIRVEGPAAPDAAVTMDGTPLPPAMIGMAVPANPGDHVVRATAKDGMRAEVRVRLTLDAHETATLALHAAPAPPPPVPVPVEAPLRRDTTATGGGRLRTTLAYASLGLGVAGLGVGTAFVVVNRSKRTDANGLCASGVCPLADKPLIQSLDQQADNASTAAWIGYGVGAAALVAGAVLLMTSPGAKKTDASSGLRPWVGPGSCGVVGSF